MCVFTLVPMPCFSISDIRSASVSSCGGLVCPSTISIAEGWNWEPCSYTGISWNTHTRQGNMDISHMKKLLNVFQQKHQYTIRIVYYQTDSTPWCSTCHTGKHPGSSLQWSWVPRWRTSPGQCLCLPRSPAPKHPGKHKPGSAWRWTHTDALHCPGHRRNSKSLLHTGLTYEYKFVWYA